MHDQGPGMIPLGEMNWKAMAAMGLVLLVGGVASLLNPFVTSLAVTAVAATAFLIAGAVQLWLAIRGQDGSSGGRLAAGAMGALMVVLALSLWLQPLAGLLTLTLMTAIFFLAIGALRVWMAMRMRHRSRWPWVALSGAMSILLGLVIVAALPNAALTTLGLLLGIELVVSGAAAIVLGVAARTA